MSPPSFLRTVTFTPARSSSALNSASRSGVLGSKERSSTWLSGIRFTCAQTRRACSASSCAWRGVSVTPFIMAYSKDIRLPVFLKYRSQASMSCSTPLPRFAGMMRERVSSSGACRETDRVNCKLSSASLSNFSVSPQVESEMWRIPMFIPSG